MIFFETKETNVKQIKAQKKKPLASQFLSRISCAEKWILIPKQNEKKKKNLLRRCGTVFFSGWYSKSLFYAILRDDCAITIKNWTLPQKPRANEIKIKVVELVVAEHRHTRALAKNQSKTFTIDRVRCATKTLVFHFKVDVSDSGDRIAWFVAGCSTLTLKPNCTLVRSPNQKPIEIEIKPIIEKSNSKSKLELDLRLHGTLHWLQP